MGAYKDIQKGSCYHRKATLSSLKVVKIGVEDGEKPTSERARRSAPGNWRLIRFTLIPEKIMDCVSLEVITGHVKDKMMTGTSQHGLIKG